MKHQLSTKKLSIPQRELLLNAGFGVVERDFISTQVIQFELKNIPENLIFTSQNAVMIVTSHPEASRLGGRKVFAVGKKTAALLQKKGFNVILTADYAAELADKILQYHKNERFLFFCGKRSLPELPTRLSGAVAEFQKTEVYDTRMTSTRMDRIFDGVLFFSPSAVQSFCSSNKLSESVAFCIGRTTASEARKYTTNIIMANQPSIENVIAQVAKYFNKTRTLSC